MNSNPAQHPRTAHLLILAAALVASAVPTAAALAQELPQSVTIWPMGTPSENIMMATLAGIVNRNTRGELLLSPDDPHLPNPRFWLNELQAKHPQVKSTVERDASAILIKYKTLLRGYVLYDRRANPDSLNIATSIAGVTDSIAIDVATQPIAQRAGLSQVADARSLNYAQAYAQYGRQFNRDMLFHLDPVVTVHLRDFAVMHRGFVFYTNPTSLGTYAARQNHAGRIFGWGPQEVDLFRQASENSQQVTASNYSWSSSTTARWKVPLAKQPRPATYGKPVKGKHYVAFVMSDGDNAQWLTNTFPTSPRWFGSPKRGNFNMTWDLTSSLAEMNPVAFNYLYSRAAAGPHYDNFVSSGGTGLTFPSEYPDANELAASIGKSLTAADQRVVSILDTAYDTSKLFAILDRPEVLGIMFKTYAEHYKGRAGSIEFHNGKPIVSVRYSLWDGADTARSLADALNNNPHRNALTDLASFSIVNVHPWSKSGPDGTGASDPMSNLDQLVRWLEADKVEVVTLEELIVYLRDNFGTPIRHAEISAP
jgi:hypothetical protein